MDQGIETILHNNQNYMSLAIIGVHHPSIQHTLTLTTTTSLGNKRLSYRDIGAIEYTDTLQKSRIPQIIDYHILLGMLDVKFSQKNKILSSGWVVEEYSLIRLWKISHSF